MRAVQTTFDGEKIIVPDEVRGFPPGNVIVVFENGDDMTQEREAWMQAQQPAFARAWDNEADSVYDAL